jgi:coenzyme F420-reducing hydrogenase delta subunit
MADESGSTEYRIEHDPANAVVRVTFTGTLDVEVIRRAAHDGLALGHTKGCARYLVDYRDTVATDATADTYFFMSNLEALGLLRSDRVAIVYARDAERHAFAELVAQNRGWANMRYVTSMAAAEEWLRST